MSAADTLSPMDPHAGQTGNRYDELLAESAEALAYAANTLRTVRDRFREAYLDEVGHWETLRDDLDELERPAEVSLDSRTTPGATAIPPESGDGLGDRQALEAAEAGAADGRLRSTRASVEQTRGSLGRRGNELARLELAIRNLDATWLFVERGDASLITETSMPRVSTELQMRIIEAQESERVRLAQEVHDGPAQALSNAIFQVDYIDRVLDGNPSLARSELRLMRERLRRELGDVRTFIGQLRPPALVELGLDGSIAETVATQAAMSGLRITTELRASTDDLAEAAQTVALRVVQESLQNVRKHAGATSVVIASRLDDGQWVLEIRDDGRGFDVGAVAARGRRNFGLQFMRERAELIGATFEMQSRPGAGTVVRLAIPLTRKENR